MMNPKVLFRALLLLGVALLTFQCDVESDETPQVQATQDSDLLGLNASIEGQVLATFTLGVPKTTLEKAEYEAMFRQMARYTEKMDGQLVNYYVEAKEGPEGLEHFLILAGELEDGSYLTTGMRLTESGEDLVLDRRGRPVPIFSCRAVSGCSSCSYVYFGNTIICYCSGGFCEAYIPGTEEN